MPMSQAPIVAREGRPFLLGGLAVFIIAVHVYGTAGLAAGGVLLLLLYLIFRDPYRDVPSVPLGVVSPVDGRVTRIETVSEGVLGREAVRICLRINNFGAYSVRCPIEGKLMSLGESEAVRRRRVELHGLWVQTEAKDDVVLQFRGPPLIGRPAAFVRYGERIGQGQRCAFVRLASLAEICLPASSRIEVKVGDRVQSGSSVLATLIHK